MRALTLVAALLAAGCGSSSTEPTRTYHAVLSTTNPIVGACVDVRCTFTAVVTNSGPDCASQVSMSIALTEGPFFPGMAVGVAVPGVLRAGQSAIVTGADWPKGGIPIAAAEATGVSIACP